MIEGGSKKQTKGFLQRILHKEIPFCIMNYLLGPYKERDFTELFPPKAQYDAQTLDLSATKRSNNQGVIPST